MKHWRWTSAPLAVALAAAALLVVPLTGAPIVDGSDRTPRVEGDFALPPAADGGTEGLRPRPPRAPAAPFEPLPVPSVAPSTRGAVRHQVVVRFRDEVPTGERAARVAALGGGTYRPSRFAPFARVAVPTGTEPGHLAAALAADPGVAWAEVDHWCRAAHLTVRPAASFDDPLLPRQWTHERIRLLSAFDHNPLLGAGVVVAVIDTGVAYGNGGSYPTRRGVDLEGTAFVPGWDFVDGDPEAFDLGVGIDDDEPFASPRFGHGTFAAAQVAAVAGNGVAGIGTAPRAAIMPVRVLGIDGFGVFSDVAEGIHFAVARGAKVINMSLGGKEGTSALEEAVRAAHAAGVVLVAAAGNEATAPDFPGDVSFPARYPQVLAVGATNFADDRASYSNTGPQLDLMAPAGDGLEEVRPGIRDGALSTSFLFDPLDRSEIYGAFWSTGTSFAVPQVAGVAALLISLGVTDPDAVRLLLLERTRDLGTPGFDTEFGAGLLDALESHHGLGFSL
ncbi:MAG TPA: S8 family serine peptidase [Thermoanaerobaculia bacterium]|nr:S8 family serine peptidase [Thermoanaerobaculia bacterium]